MFGAFAPLSTPVVLMVLPVAAYEMILAGWRIAKGFNRAPVADASPRPAPGQLLRAA